MKDIYLFVASSVDELWKLSDRVLCSTKKSMKLMMLTKLGMYMTEECFADAERYLKSIASSVAWWTSEEFFDCISQNINRLNATTTVEILIEIIREKHFHMGGKLANILLHLKIKSVPYMMQVEFCKVLEESVAFIVSNGGHPQFIASLVIQNKEIFEVLASVPNNGLIGTQKLFYDINTGSGDWYQVIIDQIETARSQFESNKNLGKFCV